MIPRLQGQGKNLLMAAAGVMGLALAVQFVFLPLFVRSGAVRREIRDREKIYRELASLSAHEEEITQAYGRYEKYLQAGLSPEEKEGSFLKEVEALARTFAVQIINQQPYTVKGDAYFTDIDLQIEIEAPLRNIISFLYSIDNSDKLMRVTQMRLVPKGDASQSFRCQVGISKRSIK